MEQKLTPMSDLRADLIETKITGQTALMDIKNEDIRRGAINVLHKTLDAVIKRIEEELLPYEREVIEQAVAFGQMQSFESPNFRTPDEYFEQKFKQ